MTKEEIIQLNTDYLNGCESEHKMNELFNYVLELQTQEPLKTGHWIVNDEYEYVKKIYCSRCKERFSFETSYCPHCGAKMDDR